MNLFKKKSEKFDKDMWLEEHTPSIGEINFEEDYFMANAPISRDKLVKDYQDYWINYKKYREAKGLKSFDETIKEIKELTTENFKYPVVHFTIKNRHGVEAKIRLSQYGGRLFAELELDDQSYNRMRQIFNTDDFLNKYIDAWNKTKTAGYGKNIHLLWNESYKKIHLCTSSKDTANFPNEIHEYRWFNETVKILQKMFMEYNDIDSKINTYSPKELEEFISANEFVGKTINDVIFEDGVSDVFKDVVELWKTMTFSFSDDTKACFEFWTASHAKITIYDSNAHLYDSKDYYGEVKKAHAFFKSIVGQKIKDIKIESAKEWDWHSVCDKGFNEKQGSFIMGIQILLENNKTIVMHDGDDFMYVSLR